LIGVASAADRRPISSSTVQVKADGCDQVLDLLGEGVGQPREPAHAHPHGEVLALDVAGVDLLRVGPAVRSSLSEAP
jgi:hypothetical protein